MNLWEQVKNIEEGYFELHQYNDELVLQIKGLREENEQLEQTLAASIQEWDGVIKGQQSEIERLIAQPVIENRFVTNAQLQDITKLLDLLEPDITDKEQLILPEESKIRQIIAAYREVRPL